MQAKGAGILTPDIGEPMVNHFATQQTSLIESLSTVLIMADLDEFLSLNANHEDDRALPTHAELNRVVEPYADTFPSGIEPGEEINCR